MSDMQELFDRLWTGYGKLNPHAQQIHQLLQDRDESVINDHIAFRTFDDPRVDMDVLSNCFLSRGYRQSGNYTFIAKKLNAKHFEHPDQTYPKVFISHLLVNQFSTRLQQIVSDLIDQIPEPELNLWDLPVSGRLWDVSFKDYEQLRSESEYAAWLAAFGFCANHFTVSINDLTTFESLEQFNKFLIGNGFELNTAGGEIKGSADQLLEQSSTLAGQVKVVFNDGPQVIPGCYYEFARRYPQPDGQLFQGFIAKSADKIFESTDRR